MKKKIKIYILLLVGMCLSNVVFANEVSAAFGRKITDTSTVYKCPDDKYTIHGYSNTLLFGAYHMNYYDTYLYETTTTIGQTFCMSPDKTAYSDLSSTPVTRVCERIINPTEGVRRKRAYDIALTKAYQTMIKKGIIVDKANTRSRTVGEAVFRWLSYYFAYGSLPPKGEQPQHSGYWQFLIPNNQRVDENQQGNLPSYWYSQPANINSNDVQDAIKIYKEAMEVGTKFYNCYGDVNQASCKSKKYEHPENYESYQALIEAGIIWGDQWEFAIVDEKISGKKVTIELEMKAVGEQTEVPNTIDWEKFKVKCTNGFICSKSSVTKKSKNAGTIKVTVNIANGNIKEAAKKGMRYGLVIETSYKDKRSPNAHMMLLKPVSNASTIQKMFVVQPYDTEARTEVPVSWEGCECGLKTDGTFSGYYENVKIVDGNIKRTTNIPITEENRKKYNCPSAAKCQEPPSCEIIDDKYYGDIVKHPDGKPVDEETYRKECLHTCQTPNESGDGNYYCKESEEGKGDGQVCDEDSYIQDCECPQIKDECDKNPDSPACDEYEDKCANCVPTVTLPNTCNNFDVEGEFEGTVSDINEIKSECNDTVNQIKKCVIGKKDLTDTSFEATNEIDNNPYCKVWCKENYKFTVPTAKYSKSGGYFTLISKINGTRDCYVSGATLNNTSNNGNSENNNGPIVSVPYPDNANDVINSVKGSWPADLEQDRINVIYKAASLLNKGVGYSQDDRAGGNVANPRNVDCSSYVTWAFFQTGHTNIQNVPAWAYTGSYLGSTDFTEIRASQLRPGDVGLNNKSTDGGNSNHIGIFIGRDSSGNEVWLHSTTWNFSPYNTQPGASNWVNVRGPQASYGRSPNGQREVGKVHFEVFYRYNDWKSSVAPINSLRISSVYANNVSTISEMKGIDEELFKKDLKKAQENVINAWNEYSHWKVAAEQPDRKRRDSASNSDCTDSYIDDNGTEICTKHCDANTQWDVYYYAWDYPAFNLNGSPTTKNDNIESGSGSCWNCQCTKEDGHSLLSQFASNRDAAKQTLIEAVNALNDVIRNYNNCTGNIQQESQSKIATNDLTSTGWNNDMNFAPEIDFEYREDYMNGMEGKFTEVEKQAEKTTVVYCEGNTDKEYNCLNGKTEASNTTVPESLLKDQSYLTCDLEGCRTVTSKISKAKWIQKSKNNEAKYQPNNKFSTYTQYGTIKINAPECEGNDCLWTRLPDTALPVPLRKGVGVFPFKFTFKNVGQSNSNSTELGRLVGKETSVLNAYNDLPDGTKCKIDDVDPSMNGSYVCRYINDCDNCDFTCVCPEDDKQCWEENGACKITEKPCEGDNCDFVCEGDNCTIPDTDCSDGHCELSCATCIFDGNNSTVKYRTVSLHNLFPNSRPEGHNWNKNSKAVATKKEIEENGEKTYEEPEYSYTLTPKQLQNIRKYNKEMGTYANALTKSGETAMKCERVTYSVRENEKEKPLELEYHVKCQSEFLNSEGSEYFTQNKRNDVFTLWTETPECANGKCLNRADGIGPSWK